MRRLPLLGNNLGLFPLYYEYQCSLLILTGSLHREFHVGPSLLAVCCECCVVLYFIESFAIDVSLPLITKNCSCMQSSAERSPLSRSAVRCFTSKCYDGVVQSNKRVAQMIIAISSIYLAAAITVRPDPLLYDKSTGLTFASLIN